LTQPAATETDKGFPFDETDPCLNTTLGSDPFSGLEDDIAMNTTPINEPGANVDVMSYLTAYMKNLTTDMFDMGMRVNASIGATNKMVFDSIIISDDEMMGMLEQLHRDLDEDPISITRAQTF
jgi:hypothetical protein